MGTCALDRGQRVTTIGLGSERGAQHAEVCGERRPGGGRVSGLRRRRRSRSISHPGTRRRASIRSPNLYNWVRVWLAPLDEDELTELVVGAWAMVVPKRLSAGRLAQLGARTVRRDEPGAPVNEDGAADD